MKHKVDAAEDTAAARAAADHGEHARGRHRYWTVGRRPRRPRDWRATRRAARADRVLAWRSGGSTSRVPLFGTAVPFGTPAGSIFGATATGLYLSSFRRVDVDHGGGSTTDSVVRFWVRHAGDAVHGGRDASSISRSLRLPIWFQVGK